MNNKPSTTLKGTGMMCHALDSHTHYVLFLNTIRFGTTHFSMETHSRHYGKWMFIFIATETCFIVHFSWISLYIFLCFHISRQFIAFDNVV